MSLENAIYYRMVSHIAGLTVADRWGYKPKSEGYKEAQKKFENKYEFISFTQLKDEIVLSWCAESVKLKNTKRSMAKVLGEDEINEENRPLFKRVTQKIKEQHKENVLNGIPDDFVENGALLSNVISEIDNSFDKIMKAAREGNVDFKFTNEERRNIEKALLSTDIMRNIFHSSVIDTDIFLEDVLKEYNKKIIESNISQKTYNDDIAQAIKANFFAKLNTLDIHKNTSKIRNRTKESIFDKIHDGKLSSMPLKDFVVGYDEMIYLYEIFTDEIEYIDKLTKFYNIESKYNLIFYINIVLDLFEDTVFGKKGLIEQVSKLALLDLCIYRSSTMKEIINKIVFSCDRDDNIFQETYNYLNDLIILKNTIVKDLLQVNSLVFEKSKEEALNLISDEAKKEINEQVKKIDIEKYLHIEDDKKMVQKILKNVKCLLENNRDILLERSRIMNIFQD